MPPDNPPQFHHATSLRKVKFPPSSKTAIPILLLLLCATAALLALPLKTEAALTRTNHINQLLQDDTGTVSVTSNTFTPPSGSLLVVSFGIIVQGSIDISGMNVSGGNLTWTRRAGPNTSGGGGYIWMQEIWTAPVTNAAPMEITVSSSATVDGDGARVQLQAVSFQGYNQLNPIGGTASDATMATNGADSLTLSSIPAASSVVLASQYTLDNGVADTGKTPASDFTEVYEGPNSSGYGNLQMQVRGSSMSTTVGWDDVATNPSANVGSSFGLSIEIRGRSTVAKPPNNLGLVGYWSFNEGTGTQATDFSGNGNHGTFQGGALWGLGKRGASVVLDGTDDYVQTPSFSPGAAGTIALWFRSNDFSDTRRFFGTADDFETIFPTGSSPATLTGDLCGSDTIDSAASFHTGIWYHLVITWDDTGDTLTSYVNGTQDNQTNGSIDCTGLAGNFNIGWRPGAPTDERFSGAIDEVRVYSRALGAIEVAKLYGSGAVKFTTSSVNLQRGSALANGLVGHWTFDGPDTQATITDRSGQNNHGYFYNGSTSSAKVIGKLGQALRFAGDDDTIIIPNSGSVAESLPAMTVSAWFKTTVTGDMWLLSKQANSVAPGWSMFMQSGAAGRINFYADDGTNYHGKTTTARYDDGNWHHVAVALSGSGTTITMYIDGSPASVTTDSSGTMTGYSSGGSLILIGNALNNIPWNGLIDDVRVYNRALSPTEVAQLYNLGTVIIRP